MILSPGSGFLPAFRSKSTTAPAPDRVVYVAPPPPIQPRPLINRTRLGGTSTRAQPVAPTTTPSGIIESNAAPPTDTATAKPKPPTRVDLEPTRAIPPSAPRVTAGAPAAAATAGFTRNSEPIQLDSAVTAVNKRFKEGVESGLLKPPPPTQDEIDTKLRAQALEAIVARGAGAPNRQVMIGASVPVGLPGGGPSNAQRARDRAIFAELQKTVALRQQKAESIATARKRRVDSLAQLADSGKRRQSPNY